MSGKHGDLRARIEALLPPYAAHLGIGIDHMDGDTPVLAFDFDPSIEGRPGYLHGGAIGGLLEMAAVVALHSRLALAGANNRYKPINITISYMRGGLENRTYAKGVVTRLGRSVANVETHAWQDDPDKPIAGAQMNFAIRSGSE